MLNGFEGVVNFISRHHKEGGNKIKRWASSFMNKKVCPECKGSRLSTESNWYKVGNTSINELTKMEISELQQWVQNINKRLGKNQQLIAKELLKELSNRIGFLINVG